jgi:AraC-like DNA-binding protein
VCHEDLLEYSRRRRAVQAVLEGRDTWMRVDAAPARRYVGRLLAAGWSKQRIAREADVSRSTVYELFKGRRTLAMDVDRRLRQLAR